MANYLGVEINLLPVSSWLTRECNNTAAEYRYTSNWTPMKQAMETILARSANYAEYGLDAVEEALYNCIQYLDNIEPDMNQYWNWFSALIDLAGPFGGNSNSCNQNRSTLRRQRDFVQLMKNERANLQIRLRASLATLQAFEQNEYDEEVMQNFINQAAQKYDQVRIDLEDQLSDLKLKEFLRKFQQFALPILLIVLAFFIFRKS